MVEGNAKLIMDLGNSETRVITQFGKSSKGGVRERIAMLDNKFGIMPDDKVQLYLNTEIYTDEDSAIFTYDGQTYCNGAVCNTEFSTTTIRPTALEKKYKSLVSKLSIINGFKQGIESVADIADCDLASVNVDWDLVLLLPPADVDTGAKPLAEMARSITSIDFKMPKVETDIRINSVTVLPEGFCAFAAVLFESKSKVRSGYAYLADPESYTIIVDIGAGTSDITLSKGSNIITSSRFTKEIGGNNVYQRVRRLLKEKGIVAADTTVRDATVSGTIKSGAKTYDIKDEIAIAKGDVSKQLVDAIQEFFEENMLPVQQINNLLVCGGGAESSNSIEPISNYIVEYMSRLSPNISLVDIPEINGHISPRLLNVLGAAIISA